MEWRWPGKSRWQPARHLHEIRDIALAAPRQIPLVQIRDGPGDLHTWMLAVAEEPDPGAGTEYEAQDHTGEVRCGRE